MKKHLIFVDGAAGTTGLRIHQRLAGQDDIELLTLPEETRKSPAARAEAASRADLSILCLPDAAARELVALAAPNAKICDTSTAHRTNPAWVYGFAELGRREKIQAASRVAVPGCHATGFLALAAPLVEKGLLAPQQTLVCQSLTGYSGGGKQMIAAYEAADRPGEYSSPRLYGLGMQHKHLPEMQAVAGLTTPPLFCPVVDDYYEGMLVSLPLAAAWLPANRRSGQDLAAFFADYYAGRPLVTVHPWGEAPADGTLPAGAMAGRDAMELFILGNAQQVLLAARFDNLGKGASGAAVQCMNLMLGREETAGLVL